MGVALYLVWKAGASRREVHLALSVFGVQLVLNSLWSILFFGMRDPGVAFAEILILWLMIVATIVTFWRVARVAAWLLVPYLAWVSFAAYLNFMIWQLN
jgi:tryptophan-rich sensory protein